VRCYVIVKSLLFLIDVARFRDHVWCGGFVLVGCVVEGALVGGGVGHVGALDLESVM